MKRFGVSLGVSLGVGHDARVEEGLAIATAAAIAVCTAQLWVRALCERMRQLSDGVLTFEEGAIYPVLHEFERGGFVESYWEDEATPPTGEGPAAASIA